jgi:glycogen synthase
MGLDFRSFATKLGDTQTVYTIHTLSYQSIYKDSHN